MVRFSAQHPIAFFCAEFGVDSKLPIYAGGLGVLAGDILKEAADQKLPMVGVGLLYRGEGARQRITDTGQQIEENVFVDPLAMGLEHVYVDDMPLFIKVHLTEVDVWVRCWRKKIGETVTLYLLDTDTDQNHQHERGIASALYAGTEEELIKQQLILGIGGVKLLNALEIHPAIYHLNEGRPCFLHWQLIRQAMDGHGVSFEEATKLAKSNTVYTNHTLVEAGNQSYTTDLLKAYGRYYADKMGINIETLLQPGFESGTEQFSVTRYALNTSRKASAVSQLHLDFCRQRWPEYDWVGVTNGAYLPYWQAPEIAHAQDQNQLWQTHQLLKQQTMEYIRNRTGFGYDPNALIISWSRRMAGYKQADALFSDITRLKRILGRTKQPIQILMAGKAHIFDTEAKQQIEKIIQIMQNDIPGFALYIPNLDMELDQMLTRGSDVWLNTPEYGKEASGTSGMKAISNGVLQCTVADGWAHEVEWSEKGWVLDHQRLSESLYKTLEQDIVPLFFQRNAQGVPEQWVKKMQASIELVKQFSATRMVNEYKQVFYTLS